MTPDTSYDPQPAWRASLAAAEKSCWTFFHVRSAEWINTTHKLWVSEWPSIPGDAHTLGTRLHRAAKAEIELRGECTMRTLAEFVARDHGVPPTVVLSACIERVTVLLREGCRDVENDMVSTARFVRGIDLAELHATLCGWIQRATDHLQEVCVETARLVR